MNRIRFSFVCCIVLLAPLSGYVFSAPADPAVSPAASPAPAVVFSDVFAAGSGDGGWKIDKGDQPFGEITRSVDPAAPGMVVVAPGREMALAGWEAGTEPFDFWFDLDLTRGSEEAWRYNGFAVALCSASPTDMTATDLCFSAGVFRAGVRCAIQTGPFYKPGADPRQARKFQVSQVSPRFEINMAGAGGEDYSVRWPKKNLAGMKLRFRIQRLAGDCVRFEIYNADGDWSKPWWVGEGAIPPKLAAIPIRYVSVLTTEEDPESKSNPSPGTVVSGRISSMQGWTGNQTPPEVTGYASGPEGAIDGKEFTVTGTNFSEGARVLINGAACQTRVTSPTELKATAAGLNTAGANRLQVVNGNGLFASYEPGIYAGLCLARVEPREALPKGGDVVTVRGGGFDAKTKISFNGKAAEVVGQPLSDAIQVKVPAGDAGLAKVTASKGGEAFAGGPRFGYAPHPYLLFKGEEGMAAVKARFADPAFAPYRKSILDEIDKEIAASDEPKAGKFGQINEVVLGSAFAYRMTGDAKYKDAALKYCDRQLEGGEGLFPQKESGYPGGMRQNLDRDEFLVMTGGAFALVYDTLFDEMTPELRTSLEHYLDDYTGYYRDRVAKGDWWYAGNPSNTIPVGSGNSGTAALALRYSTPDADATVAMATKTIKDNYRAIQDDGGCVEGNMYWDYGLGAELGFGLYLQNALGDDKGMLGEPKFSRMVDFVATQLGGDGNMFVFNDTQPWISGLVPSAFAESRFDQPLMRWTCDEMVRRGAVRVTDGIRAFLFRDSKPMLDKMPDLPTMAYMKVLNWGVLRSSPQAVGSGLVVGVKGVGGTQTHHHEEDAGSFVVESAGESFLISPGYYQGTAPEHTVPLIGKFKEGGREGEDLSPVTTAPISDAWEAGKVRSMTVDSTASYKVGSGPSPANLVRRVLVLDDDKAVVALDQVEPSNPADGITSFYQCGFVPTLLPDDKGFRIEGKNSDVVTLIDGPKGALSVEGPFKWHQEWIFAKLNVQWRRIRAPYAFTPDEPRISVILPLAKGAPVPAVTVSRAAGSISVTIPGAQPVSFTKDGNLWKAARL